MFLLNSGLICSTCTVCTAEYVFWFACWGVEVRFELESFLFLQNSFVLSFGRNCQQQMGNSPVSAPGPSTENREDAECTDWPTQCGKHVFLNCSDSQDSFEAFAWGWEGKCHNKYHTTNCKQCCHHCPCHNNKHYECIFLYHLWNNCQSLEHPWRFRYLY